MIIKDIAPGFIDTRILRLNRKRRSEHSRHVLEPVLISANDTAVGCVSITGTSNLSDH
jgi:hypothetical protein